MSIADELATVYDAQSTEKEMYKFWEDNEFFKADNKSDKPPFSMVIPPPTLLVYYTWDTLLTKLFKIF